LAEKRREQEEKRGQTEHARDTEGNSDFGTPESGKSLAANEN